MNQNQYRQSSFYGDAEAWNMLLDDHESAIELSHHLADQFLKYPETITNVALAYNELDKSSRIAITLRNDGTLEDVRRVLQKVNATLPAAVTPVTLSSIWRTLVVRELHIRSIRKLDEAKQAESEAENATT